MPKAPVMFALLGVLLLTGCGSVSTPPAAPSSETATTTFDVEGAFYAASHSGERCELMWGAWKPSLESGQVTVHDGAGAAVAMGELLPPTASTGQTADGDDVNLCVYEYRVPGVPRGVGPYTFEVGNDLVSVSRFTEADASQPLEIAVNAKD